MSNERKLRLIQVAKEFKVGLNTITDFLQKKGIKTDGSPNTLVEPDVYAVLEKEFGGSRITGNERESIRERISQKQATITLEEAQKQTREEEQEVIIKSNVISVKDELPQPKILGKIDLSPFDEPTSALDPELTGEVLAVMRQLAEEGMTMLVVTHEMGFARNVSSKTVFMENGVVVEQAPSHEFFANPKEERTREFLRKIAHTE